MNIYAEPSFQSAITTQCILGETLTVLERQDEWFRVRQWDNYTGWIYGFYVVNMPDGWSPGYRFGPNIGSVYASPSKDAEALRQISAGVILPGTQINDRWAEVQLPDRQPGFVEHKPHKSQSNGIREEILETAERFLGTSYFWGGKTGYGFDCSGFVQTVFRLNGIELRRDAWMQAEMGTVLSGRDELEPGDLVFFTERERISHVGIAYNKDDYIHCSGFVRRNSFSSEAKHSRKQLDENFTCANRIIQVN